MSVSEIDVVTADGEFVRADERQHERLLWAARGAAPGFFGVVTVATDVSAIVQANAITLYPDGYRYAVDSMWTSASFDELADGYRTIASTLPPAPSHMMWMNWGPATPRPDMAFSLEDQTYIGLYGIWPDGRDDAGLANWATDRMRELGPLSSGIQLSDENLARRPAPFMAPDNLRRLEEIRDMYDPTHRFHTWLVGA